MNSYNIALNEILEFISKPKDSSNQETYHCDLNSAERIKIMVDIINSNKETDVTVACSNIDRYSLELDPSIESMENYKFIGVLHLLNKMNVGGNMLDCGKIEPRNVVIVYGGYMLLDEVKLAIDYAPFDKVIYLTDPLEVPMSKSSIANKDVYIGNVDEYGCISPTFNFGAGNTSGSLKYLGNFKGKTVKLTIEIME